MLTAEREKAYLDILERGILNVRALLARGDVRQAVVEANHVHNLPGLLRGDAGQTEQDYWDFARVTYLRESGAGWPSAFREVWDALEPQASTRSPSASVS